MTAPSRGDLGPRPVIGITCYVEPVTRGEWVDVPHALLPADYVRQVERAGGIAVLIPPREDADDDLARAIMARLDGVVLAGGSDVEPERYGAVRHPSVAETRRDRDALELALARVTRELDAPVLGICRGMQVMAVASGGTLHQHLPDLVGHADHSPGEGEYGNHPVNLVPGTVLHGLLGGQVPTHSHHHQAVAAHPGYAPSGWAPDGTLEAMEDGGARFRLAVQWHPEAGTDARLFHALVAACSA